MWAALLAVFADEATAGRICQLPHSCPFAHPLTLTATFPFWPPSCPLQREKEGEAARDDRKRGYNSLAGAADAEVTPEEMEAYRLKKNRGLDPMDFINKSKDLAAAANGGSGADGYDYV